MANSVGGSARPVNKVLAGSRIVGRCAIPVVGFPTVVASQPVDGGRALQVYVVTQADINAGLFRIEGNCEPIPMCTVSDGRAQDGGSAIPVWVVSGSL